ncbi:hypothetical protein [Sporosarcina sp. FA9]|uniref:hypothetical protein n=1 Tax=Sporosarcina sp. FA9 TaxID=3413030 RepID=UPI003F6580F1
MRLLSIIFILFFIPLILMGCTGSPGQSYGGTLSKKQVLKLDPEADIFEFEDQIYKAGVDWIEEEELTKGKLIGEITNGVATKLPIGTKIFSPNERLDILIVESDGREIKYLLQIGE